MKQQVKISKVQRNPNNPRIIKNDKFKKLVKSIQEFPEMLKLRPIVVDEDMMVLGGNMRLKASKDAGLKEVWIEIAEGLTEEQKKEFIVKDNVGFGEWEWDMLANEWDSMQLAEWGLDVWENLDDKEPEAGLIDDDEIPEVKESKVKRGDIWLLGEHRLMCGDSTSSDDVAKLMNGEKADMVFTDPPYGVNYQGGVLTKRTKLDNDQKNTNIYQDFLPNIIIYTEDKAPIYIWHAAGYADMASHLGDVGIKIRSQIIWNKNMAQFGALSAQYKQKHEPCFYCYKKGNAPYWYGATNEVTVWDVSRESKNEYHPTQKPIELSLRALNNSSKISDIVLDLFLGSGSTLIAAEKLNRKCYGMELDEKYCDVIIERWEQFTGKKAKKI
jgi:DNA modification methylase